MTKRRKFLLTVALGLAVAAVILAFTWQRIAIKLMSASTAREFRRSYSPGATAPATMAQRDWAWRFGGKAGLPRLQRLTKDESLTPQGRLLAAQLRDLIATGGHLAYLRTILEAKRGQRKDIEPPAWPTIALIEYIYERDSR